MRTHVHVYSTFKLNSGKSFQTLEDIHISYTYFQVYSIENAGVVMSSLLCRDFGQICQSEQKEETFNFT